MPTPLAALRPGQELDAVLACTRKERLLTRTGSPYLALELRDASGSIGARVFRDADVVAGRFERGDLVAVVGRAERFRDELQLEVLSIARADDGAADAGAFLPRTYRDLEELDGFLEHWGREVHDRGLRRLLDGLMGDEALRAEWRRAPCTRGGHHAYLGGLLEHTVAVAALCAEACALHVRLDSDLLLCAALVHDLGKVREFTYGAEFGFTAEGALLGHVVLGARLIEERALAAGVEAARRDALLHCVLGHHGPEGLPGRRFALAEALALHRVNALDATVKEALEHGLR